MTIYPGAKWVPVPGQQNRPQRRKGRGVGYHVAAYSGPSIEKIDEGTGNDSHLYVRADGSVEQNIDLDLISYAMVDGNATLITVETEGGAVPATVNTEPWTPQQQVTLAAIARWAHATEGVPLQLMPDSKSTSRGLGTHRLGITHSRGLGAVPGWRIAGGESWSSSIGKACPGDAKVAQMPHILTLAIQGDDMTPDEHDLLVSIHDLLTPGIPKVKFDGDIYRKITAIAGTVGSTGAAVAELLTKPGVSAADIAAAIPAGMAQQVVVELGKIIVNTPSA